MNNFDASAPVIIGVGEASRRTVMGEWITPVDLAAAAIKVALDDCGAALAVTAATDCSVAIRTFEDSGVARGMGSPDNVAQAYAAAAGLSPNHFIYGDVGGQSPQAMVNEMAAALRCGEYKVVVIAGAEANGTAKRAQKVGHALDWRIASDTAFDNRLSSFPILSRTEIRHGIISMPLAYGMIESARRTRIGMDVTEYERDMARLWSALSVQSLHRRHAQFAAHWDADDLRTDGGGNYRLTAMYRRWVVAQDAVDLGAALILTTAGTARALGVALDKMIWLVGSAEAAESPVTTRFDPSKSEGLRWAVSAALEQSALSAKQLGPVDIYSCFPCAVSTAIEVIGDPARDWSDYSLTGGLSFFGGPGNCYALHSITALIEKLRQDGSSPGMITANGGVMSKQAVGIYSAHQPAEPYRGETAKAEFLYDWDGDQPFEGRARIIAHTRPITEGAPGPASLLVDTGYGGRCMAVLSEAPDTDLNRLFVNVTSGEKRNSATLI